MCAVDSSQAGEGWLEIVITGPQGKSIPHSVDSVGPSTSNVTFQPTDHGLHHVSITFNKENVTGNVNVM